MANSWSVPLLLILVCFSTANANSYNVVDFGAQPDGQTDSAGPFLRAWDAACGAGGHANVVVPKGRFFVSKGLFHGPCNSTRISVFVFGSVVAQTVFDKTQTWLAFRYVDGLEINRGALDGGGKEIWDCKSGADKDKCPNGATTLSINHCKNVRIDGLTLINSQYFHLAIFASEGVTVQNTKIIAPGNSPNTDGIHVGMSTGVTLTNVNIRTGDDCISLGPGSTHIFIDSVYCGPGHGISIGSLGEVPEESGVRNVTVKRVVVAGTTNGLRIKSYGRASNGFVDKVSFRHAILRNVENPIIIDQNYCPSKQNCPRDGSGIKISNVEFKNINGTSETPVAIKLDCSPKHPCTGIRLSDIKLTYRNQRAKSFCRNALGTKFSNVSPPVTCF